MPASHPHPHGWGLPGGEVKKRKGERRKRKEEVRKRIPYRYLIVCEGTKTEPNYFDGIKKCIEKTYKNRVEVILKPEIEIEGTGKNTINLVDYALKKKRFTPIPYGHVWVVFDKDSFTDEQFNNAILKAEDNDINAAWSNEAIELWFLLHFEYMDAPLHRSQYQRKLEEHFRKLNINKGRYQKNLPNIFEILTTYGNVERAISYSEKLYRQHENSGINSPARMNPCTTVHNLVKELLE